ncbi:tyrosine-type recombinase/integrase [Bremerella sp. P1]|uniref:tyrosine-type recombinase/integrase n=1 Tax=Bremerella sp. P1 TaxID=3026424 RepID=UPI002367D2F0|nr:site-specific integrase [Bremerella sp. P1]WDI43365.1 site-specific integrase [Bremerella sp. P1]
MATVTLYQPTVTKSGKKTKSKTWVMKWKQPNGKYAYETTKTRDKSVANQIRREKERQLALAPWGISTAKPTRIKWSEFSKAFLDGKKGRTRPLTIAAYKQSLDNFQKAMGDLWLDEVTIPVLQGFIGKRLESVVPPTVNKDLRSIRTAINWAVEQNHQVGTTKFKGLIVREDLKNPTVIDPSIRQAMLAALDKDDLVLKQRSKSWWRLYLLLLEELGARRCEIMAIPWKNWNRRKQTLTIPSDGSGNKARRERELPAVALHELLDSWFVESGKPKGSEPILPWTGKDIRAFYFDWDAIADAAGIPVDQRPTPQEYRSTCGTELVAAGVPTAEASRYLGHSTSVTTERYYLNAAQSLAGAAEKRRKFFGEAEEPKAGQGELAERLAKAEALNERLLGVLENLGGSTKEG